MKRNSKQLLAILLSAVMTFTPAVPVMAEGESDSVSEPAVETVTEPEADTVEGDTAEADRVEEPVVTPEAAQEEPEAEATTADTVETADPAGEESADTENVIADSRESADVAPVESVEPVEKVSEDSDGDAKTIENTESKSENDADISEIKTRKRTKSNDVKEKNVESKTHSITVNVINSKGEVGGMYAMDQAVVTEQEDGTYLVRMHQSSANRNYMAVVADTSDKSKDQATNHEVDWLQGGGSDGYWFVIRVFSLDSVVYASFSSTDRVAKGNEWSGIQTIRFDVNSLADTEAAAVTPSELNVISATSKAVAKTHAITVQVINSNGEVSGMYAMEQAIVTEQEDGTYLIRMHQKKKNRNYMAIVPDTSETSKDLAKNHEVNWYLGGGSDGYWFVIPVNTLDSPIYASFSRTENVKAGKEWSEIQTIQFDVDSLVDTEEAEVSKSEINALKAVLPEAPIDDKTNKEDKNPTDNKDNTSQGDQKRDGNVLKDGSYSVNAETGAGMFKIVNAELTVKNGKMTAIITLSGTGYDYLYAGTKAEAEKASSSNYIPVLDTVDYVDANGDVKTGARYEVPVSALDKTLDFASHSINRNLWYARTITFASNSLKAISVNNPTPGTTTGSATTNKPAKGNNNTKNSSDTSKGSTSGSSTVGKYSFTWSGGSGRVNIILNSVSIEDGQAYATITFVNVSGRPASYDSVRVNGQTISGSNTFKIPVTLNKSMTIEGRTTAMSTPHWVAYQIFVGDGNGGAVSSTVAENVKTLDEKAPEITGLKFESETELPYTNKVKLFNYDQGIKLIEISVSTGNKNETADGTSAEETTSADDSKAAARPGSETPAVDDNIENTNKANTSETNLDAERAALYLNPVIKYLIVPEGVDVPAGLDTQAVIIKLPADKTLLASTEAMEVLEQIDALENVTALAIDPKEVMAEALKSDKILAAGTYDDWDLKGLIQAECNLAIESSKILPKKDASKEETEAAKELLQKYADRAVQMDMPILIDRSADEENALAAAEWYKIYGAIYGKEAEAEKLYNEVVSKASDADKAAAADALK